MAIVTVSQGFSFLNDQDWGWKVTASSSSQLIISSGSYTQTFTGHLTYDSNDDVFGTVTGISLAINSSRTYSISGLKLDAHILQKYAENIGDTQAAYAYVLNGNDTITGSYSNDILLGYAGNDTLNGGSGSDTLLGGRGNDTYYVNSSLDKVYETTVVGNAIDAGGVDTIISTISFNLASYAGVSFVENLRLGNGNDINGFGNSLNNTIFAGNGNNIINGGAGSSDTASYLYSTAAITADLHNSSSWQKTGGSGKDWLLNIENLAGSSFNDTLTGNQFANTLIGYSGNDILRAAEGNDILSGGTGNDVLYGGSGKDIFRFDSAIGTASIKNIDQIKDFSVFDDTIQIENAVFKKLLTPGILSSAFFVSNTSGKAMDANDYLVYDKDGGILFYDADGNGGGAAVPIATLGVNLALTHADFMII